MRTVILLLLAFSLTAYSEPMYLPIVEASVKTGEWGESERCSATLKLDQKTGLISSAVITIGEKKFDLPVETLKKIEAPDLSSLRIETEKGRRGALWYTLRFGVLKHTEFRTWYNISIVDGVFHSVCKVHDEPHKETDSIKRNFDTLWENKEGEQGGGPNRIPRA